ncbi:UDP-N-acetylmuramate--L-alanine ligase, partial [Patescibacteria group bacterium]|nr:UDP-N-acetylmuramate--L-alanine ligase [Patescibacteria group bacterium]
DPETVKVQKHLQVFGEHNRMNALAAYRVGELLGIPKQKILEGLTLYRGAWRRFEYRGEFDGAKIFDDYAHNPEKVKAMLAGAAEQFPKKQIWCVFQPHQLERTKLLFNDFVKSFDKAHHTVLLDIYQVAGRETKNQKKEVNSFELAQAIAKRNKTNAYYLPYRSQLRDFFKDSVGERDIVIMTGAGDIWKLTDQLIY